MEIISRNKGGNNDIYNIIKYKNCNTKFDDKKKEIIYFIINISIYIKDFLLF